MTVPQRGTIIDGIGDEVIYGFILCATAFVPVFYMLQRWNAQRNAHSIHPDSQASVQEAREHLPENAPATPSAPPLPENPTPNTPNNRPINRRQRNNDDLNCPICMGHARLAIETNCGHLFCGNCFVLYWQHGNWLGAVRCPICRQTVTLLFPCFSDEENRESSAEKTNVVNQVNAYNRRFSGEPRSILDYIMDAPTLMRHFISEIFSLAGMIRLFNARIIVCLLAAVMYLVSPLDIIPEAVFGLLGFLDDIFVLLLISVYLTIIYRGIVAQRAYS